METNLQRKVTDSKDTYHPSLTVCKILMIKNYKLPGYIACVISEFHNTPDTVCTTIAYRLAKKPTLIVHTWVTSHVS